MAKYTQPSIRAAMLRSRERLRSLQEDTQGTQETQETDRQADDERSAHAPGGRVEPLETPEEGEVVVVQTGEAEYGGIAQEVEGGRDPADAFAQWILTGELAEGSDPTGLKSGEEVVG